MDALETLFDKRLKLANRQRSLGEKGAFDIAALQDLILITVNESRTNQKRFEDIMQALSSVIATLQKQRQSLQHVQVVNMEKPARDVRVTNLNEVPRTVRIEDFNVKLPKEFELKRPSWWRDFSFTRLSKELEAALSILLNGVKKSNLTTKVINKNPKDAIPVRLVTPDGGAFYKAEGEASYAVVGGAGAIDYGGSPVVITPVNVTDTGDDSYTLTTGKKTLSIQNGGSKIVAFGGQGLNYEDAPKLTQRQWYQFLSCPKNFKLYFKCASTETSKIVGFER